MLPFASEAKQVRYSALCGLQRHKALATGTFLTRTQNITGERSGWSVVDKQRMEIGNEDDGLN